MRVKGCAWGASATVMSHLRRLMRMNIHSHKTREPRYVVDLVAGRAKAGRRRAARAHPRSGGARLRPPWISRHDDAACGGRTRHERGQPLRYFPSKEAIVEGLCAVDQAERARAFAELMADNCNILKAISAGLRKHVLMKPPEKARLIVEIWAEAGRNPRVAQLTRAIDADVLAGLMRLMDAAKEGGVASAKLDSRFGARFFLTFVAGIFKRIAIEADFDRDAETTMAVGALKALFAGALSPEPPAPAEEA